MDTLSEAAVEYRRISKTSFCIVVLFQVVALSIALDCGLIEFLYFLVLAGSQICGGILILGFFDRSPVTRNLPEAIVLGFVIGVGIAVVAQLLLRDLIGFTWPVSPYTPIFIGVFASVLRGRNVFHMRIARPDIETLLWLLLPVPALLSAFNWTVFAFVAVPTGLVLLKTRGQSTKRLLGYSTAVIAFGSLVVWSLTSRNTNNGSGISRVINDDARFDLAHSIGVSTWGISSNIDFAGYHFSYYKIAFLWIGPILAPIGDSGINIIEYAIPIFLIILLSFALWTFSMTIFNSLKVAGLSSSLLYLQVLLPDSIQINLRVVHLLALIFLIAGLSTCIQIQHIATINSFFIFLICGFFIAGTRLQFFPQVLLACVLAVRNQQLQIRRPKAILGAGFAMAIGALLAVLLFSGGLGGNDHNQLIFSSSSWPFTFDVLLPVAVIFVFGTTIPYTLILIRRYRNLNSFFLLSLSIFFLCQFFFPRLFLRDIDFFVAYFLVCAGTISFVVLESLTQVQKNRGFVAIITTCVLLGVSFRLGFDFFHQGIHRSNFLLKVATWLTRRETLLNITFVMTVLVIAITVAFFAGVVRRADSFIAVGIFFANIGVFAATSLNPLSDAVFNRESLFSTRENIIVERWENAERNDGVFFTKIISQSDDIVATNFGIHRQDYGIDDYRPQLIMNRQLYLSSKYSISEVIIKILGESREYASENKADYRYELIRRFETSINFAVQPSEQYLTNMTSQGVSLYVVDLERTPLRSWEPWATTEFINDKVAVLRLAKSPTS